MYHGNAGDFIDELNRFLIKEYNTRLYTTESGESVILVSPAYGGWYSPFKYISVEDREDFEEYILDYVSKCLNVKIEKI